MTLLDGVAGTAAAAGAPREGPGRPAGARNKRARAWQDWIAASGQHPIEFLAGVMRKETAVLAAEMGLKTADALGLQIRAAGEILPYVEQKLPQAVEVDVNQSKRTVLVIGQMTDQQAASMSSRFGFRLKENQGVSEVELCKSDDDKSETQPNLLDHNDNDFETR